MEHTGKALRRQKPRSRGCELRMGRKVAGATLLIEVESHQQQQEKDWQTEKEGRSARSGAVLTQTETRALR